MTTPGFVRINLMGYLSIAYVVTGGLLGFIIPVSVLGACLVTSGIVVAMMLPSILKKMSVSDLEFSETWSLPIFLGAWLLGLVFRGVLF